MPECDPHDIDPPDHSGELVMSATIRCGACVIHPIAWWMANVDSRTGAAKMARSRGWRLTKWAGWICPECAKRSRKKGSKTDA
jgi:hypothetical protein